MAVRLVIEQQRAVIGIQQSRPRLEVRESAPPVLQLRRQLPRLQISGGKVAVRIDQTRCFSERGFKPLSELGREQAELGRQAALKGIARRSVEGDFLAAIEKGTGVADLAWPEEKKEVGLALLPRSRPVVEFIEESLQIRVDAGGVAVSFTPGEIEMGAPGPPYVLIYLQRRPFIQVKMLPERLDATV
ncbi:DUF6470 family protein [Thermodesulfitimonas autotrophica]|uniref:DUF6470 family protein n=1 Tax=Thermodesulfitimonas autotrophica TaxID=1894989 RepID=UPI000F4F48DB|nr:DUF6470 family protein [Thermodesulfitimonas autotrophica]